MSSAVHAEWTKLRTLSGTGWLLLGVIALTVALGAAADSTIGYSRVGQAQDTTKTASPGSISARRSLRCSQC